MKEHINRRALVLILVCAVLLGTVILFSGRQVSFRIRREQRSEGGAGTEGRRAGEAERKRRGAGFYARTGCR